MKRNKHGRKWRPEEVQKAKAMRFRGCSYSQISDELGRTECSIAYKLNYGKRKRGAKSYSKGYVLASQVKKFTSLDQLNSYLAKHRNAKAIPCKVLRITNQPVVV